MAADSRRQVSDHCSGMSGESHPFKIDTTQFDPGAPMIGTPLGGPPAAPAPVAAADPILEPDLPDNVAEIAAMLQRNRDADQAKAAAPAIARFEMPEPPEGSFQVVTATEPAAPEATPDISFVEIGKDGTARSVATGDPDPGRFLAGSSGWTPPELAGEAAWEAASIPMASGGRRRSLTPLQRHEMPSGDLITVIGDVAVGEAEGDLYIYEKGVAVAIEGRLRRSVPILMFGPLGAIIGLIASLITALFDPPEEVDLPPAPPLDRRIANYAGYTGSGLGNAHHNAVWLPFDYLQNIEVAGVVNWTLRLIGPGEKAISVRATSRTKPGFSKSSGVVMRLILGRTRESSTRARIYELAVMRFLILGVPSILGCATSTALAILLFTNPAVLPQKLAVAGNISATIAASLLAISALSCFAAVIRLVRNLVPAGSEPRPIAMPTLAPQTLMQRYAPPPRATPRDEL
jgi:hypothetical protein